MNEVPEPVAAQLARELEHQRDEVHRMKQALERLEAGYKRCSGYLHLLRAVRS